MRPKTRLILGLKAYCLNSAGSVNEAEGFSCTPNLLRKAQNQLFNTGFYQHEIFYKLN
ncbi:hypothetical protein [Paenibacillus dendrobii]|uniref:hypothetical protein n=1 Tax=Paenibacillus dendrobii TaxID=2691084 RepID=UPI00136AD5CB|nr:hypothetical protein [Paenibacillus dendrobii]